MSALDLLALPPPRCSHFWGRAFGAQHRPRRSPPSAHASVPALLGERSQRGLRSERAAKLGRGQGFNYLRWRGARAPGAEAQPPPKKPAAPLNRGGGVAAPLPARFSSTARLPSLLPQGCPVSPGTTSSLQPGHGAGRGEICPLSGPPSLKDVSSPSARAAGCKKGSLRRRFMRQVKI